MSTNIPAQPAAPDYSKATQEGIYTDIDTLGTRLAINQGARLGSVVTYVDPRTGQEKTADFTGMGDMAYAQQAADLAALTNATTQREQLALREELGVKNAEQTRKELEASDPTAFATREALTKRLQGDLDSPDEVIQASQGFRDAAARFGQLADSAPRNDGRLKDLYSEAGKINTGTDDMGQLGVMQQIQARLAGSAGSRPTLGALQQQAAMDQGAREFGQLKRGAAMDRGASPTLDMLEAEAGADAGASRTLQRLGRQSANSDSPNRFGSIYDEATRLPTDARDGTTDLLNESLQKAYADYQLGGKLDEDSKRDLLNEVRAGQAARGNFLGDAAAVAEATELGKAGDARKAQRLATLTDLQSRAFGQNSTLRGESNQLQQDRLDRLAELQSQGFTQEQAQRMEQANYATARAGEAAQLRGERANYATGSAAQRAGLRGEQAGYVAGGSGQRAQTRGEQAGYATAATGEQNTQAAQLAALAQQIFGTGQSMRTEERGAQTSRLGLMSGIAGQDFSQDQQAFGTRLNAAGQYLNSQQAMAAEERAARQETLGRSQQKLANVSAMVLGQPITNQFGSLGGAQQGAVAYNPTGYQGGIQLNQNAGKDAAGFAQQSFGTNANMWTTQANIAQQDNAGKMSMISGVAGAAMGMI